MNKLTALLLLALLAPVCAAHQPEELRINILSLLSPREAVVSATGTLVIEAPDSSPRRIVLAGVEDILLRTDPETGLYVQVLGEEFPALMVDVIPAGETSLKVQLLTPKPFSRKYYGSLSVASRNDTLQFILHKNLEDYVVSAAISEFGLDEVHLQSFLAGIVCIRSYVLSLRQNSVSAAFDFYDHTGHLYFTGSDTRDANTLLERFRDQIAETDGLVLTADNRIIPGYFSAACGGSTSDIGAVWGTTDFNGFIKGVDCPSCRENSEAGWSRSLPVGTILEALAKPVDRGANLSLAQDRKGIVILTDTGLESARYTAESFRIALGRTLGWNTIPGNHFVLTQQSGTVHVNGRGRGHGVGLCQAGAMAMSRSGRGWREILQWYFPEVEIRPAAD